MLYKEDIVDIPMKYFPDKPAMYGEMARLIGEMADETDDLYAVLANTSALFSLYMKDVSWTGFYLMKRGRLVLGPFQGKPAVAEIAAGRGVCGTAAEERRTQIVADVHSCKNHIACDASTASEIVVPLLSGSALYGVIDIDSRKKARFDEEDAAGLAACAAMLVEKAFEK